MGGGCSIAAACDFMIYLERNNPKYTGLTGLPDVNNITKDQYIDFFYYIGSNYITPISFVDAKKCLEEIISSSSDHITYSNATMLYSALVLMTNGTFTWGVMPWDYPQYVNKACSSINVQQIDFTKVSLACMIASKLKWHSGVNSICIDRLDCIKSLKSEVKKQLVERIKSSLLNDCPVTLCYGLLSEYTFYTDTKLTLPYGEEVRNAPHYVNMTEYVIDNIANEEYITIATWGQRLYIEPNQIFCDYGIGGSLIFYST